MAHSAVSICFIFTFLHLGSCQGKKDMQLDKNSFCYLLIIWSVLVPSRAHSPDSNHRMFKRHMFSFLKVVEETLALQAGAI